jgi:hypothetical protein
LTSTEPSDEPIRSSGPLTPEINACGVADVEAETSRSILPVLATRSSLIDSAVDEMFGPLRKRAVRPSQDAAGWAGGRLAADR